LELAAHLDLNFIHRVYRTTLILLLVSTPLMWSIFRTQAALGWLVGALLALGVVASVEWSVRQFFQGMAGGGAAGGSGGKMIGLYLLKVVVIGALMVGAFYLRKQGLLSFKWLLIGFPLPAVVVLLKFMGIQLRAVTAADQDASPPPASKPRQPD
jgi:hypothetical protein